MRETARAFMQWHYWAETQRIEKEAIRAALARLQNRGLTAGFNTWRETAFDLKMQQLALRQVSLHAPESLE